jgi:sirohydrochlorin cobaltochelatase
MINGPALVIAGHGSRDEQGAREFLSFAHGVADLLPGVDVAAGFIELSPPPVSAAVDDLVARGAKDIAVVPLMLLAAGHAKDDIPALLTRERLRHPDVRFRYSRDLGIRPELLAVVDDRLNTTFDPEERADTAVVLVGRGSSDPDANGDLFKIARLIYEGRPYPMVEPCFIGITTPLLEEGLRRCVRLGTKRIAVVPYFLFTGVLERRIRANSLRFGKERGIDVRVTGYLGGDPRIARLVAERYREAIDGDARMNCDMCIHRVALPGFEDEVGAPATPHYHPDVDGHAHDGHSHRHDHGAKTEA